ncbi:MAG: thiamine pyrophosphate protein central region [Solirubrobacterales bacterium]|nr:thiamine pyrophosphate protein central region [Solirubrobacterales bacterium]
MTSVQAVRTVREATYDVLRAHGLTTLFSNPGSTEVAFLAGLPDDLEFVLGLHEGSVVGMASGYAIGRGEPALVLLHTTAGLGNAVSALATARVNRAPLVVIVGQQDRRHLPLQPFLAGKLEGLAGEYPVWVDQPARAQDVPSAIARAAHEAVTGRGPAIVIVPMDDWLAPAEGPAEIAAPTRVVRPPATSSRAVDELAALLADARSPALVVGAGAASDAAWSALTDLADRLGAPVFQESFGGRPGFPQDHPRFAGALPADRPRLRAVLAGHDLVLAVGAPIFRQYSFEAGPLVEPGTRLAIVSDDPDEVHRSPADLAVLADPAAICSALARQLPGVGHPVASVTPAPPAAPTPPDPGGPLRPGHVLHELGRRVPADVILVEESPSSRPELEKRLPARTPLGFVSAAMGGLGFALPATIGLRMACPARPVVAVVGDGSSLYQVQALWSAAHYGVGALFVVLVNGRYAIMDRLAERHGQPSAWPAFEEIDVAGLATSLGCRAQRVVTHDELVAVLDDVIPTLAERERPLLLAVEVAPDAEFAP